MYECSGRNDRKTNMMATTERTEIKINSKDFRLQEGDKVKLKKWPPLVKPVYQSEEAYQELLAQQVAELSNLQQLHDASNRYAVLLIFQAIKSMSRKKYPAFNIIYIMRSIG
jgi:polyphosphate kinase 2 (PPK2 family)